MDQGILCFICGEYAPSSEIQNHVFKCKLTYEGKKKVHLTLPEEYNLLFKTIKGGLSLSDEDLENFNNLIASKSVKKASQKLTNDGFSNTMSYSNRNQGGGNFSNTMPQQRRKSPPRMPGEKPRMLVCPLCGREFGTASLEIHMKSCKKKFEIQQQDLPKNMRRNADKIIASYNQNMAMMGGGGGYNNMDYMNAQAYDAYNNQALVPCENCGRTFLPDRLLVHLRSCKKK